MFSIALAKTVYIVLVIKSVKIFFYTACNRNCKTFSILPCRVTPAVRSAHDAAVYNQKLWVFADYDGSKRSAFNHVFANQVFLVRDCSFFFGGGGWHRREKGWLNKILSE